jgi:uncharacterized protein (TIGR03086 family)
MRGDDMATEGFEQAVGVTKSVLANVKPDQLDDPTPCASWKVRDLVNHLVGGSYFFAAATNGETIADGADAPDFASGDFRTAYEEGSKQAVAAFAAPGAMERLVKVPFGEFPGIAWMGLATTDTFTHAWDLAKATGQSTDLAPELAEQVLAGARHAISDDIRGDEPMPFAAERPCPDGASAADRLAAFLGRTV